MSSHVVFQEVEGEVVLLDMKDGKYFSLDDVGSRMWQLLMEHGNPGEVVSAVVSEFDVDEETVRADLDELLARLLEAGLLSPAEPAE